ncbi:unnamed protein product [Rhizoctonia solani]|uniref:BTB domain-containing protein n=1 Tax=Rhizoctonia solani TaxID=456999 RepID=A0A8H2XQQ1_9AGAM|nr:unnamed protein product [Rhizoctonia solani]
MHHSARSDDDRTPRTSTFATGGGRLTRSPVIDVISASSPNHTLPAPVPALSDIVNVARLFPPFEGCDLVLRATKNSPPVEFYVDRETIYSHCSYLKGKISALGLIPTGIDVISWEDDANILDAMLRFIYSDRPKPKIESVFHLRLLLRAARKYDIEAAMHALGTGVLLAIAESEPLSAFVIACEVGLVDEATLISKETLKVDIMMDEKNSELGRVSLSYYHRLLRLHRLRAAKAVDIISLVDAEHPMNEFDPPYCEGCGTNATWWQIFVQYGSIELKRRPVTDTVFSAAFLAKCVRTSRHVCGECIDSYMHTYSQTLLTRLKEDIDALPAYIQAFH